MKRIWILSLLLALSGAVGWACFNVEFAPRFAVGKTPPLPLGPYTEGKLGVVPGYYLHEYLFVAFRHISGLGLTPAEVRAFAPEPGGDGHSGHQPTSQAEWFEATRRFHTTAEMKYHWWVYRRIPGQAWNSYLNCPDAAFSAATATFRDRRERFGEESVELQAWLSGQDAVFSNCPAGDEIPETLPASFDPIIQADRQYQIASALFYSEHWDEASNRFEAIARDPDSPWSKWGDYLAARCHLRKGTLGGGPGEFDRAELEEAERRFERIMADPALSHVHQSTRGLLQYIAAFLRPEERMQEVAARLVSEGENPEILRDWLDYDYLLDRGHGRGKSDLTSWIGAMRREVGAKQTSLARWRETRSIPWLLAALSLCDGSDAAAGELMEAAAGVESDNPGYLSVTYHRMRLLLARGETDLGRQGLDQVLDNLDPTATAPARNPFLALRWPLSQSLEEFLRFAPQVPLDRNFRGAGALTEPYLDGAALEVFNKSLPLEILGRIVEERSVPEGIRRELALAAWVRSHLIDASESVTRLAPKVAQFWPELRPDLDNLAREADPVSRRSELIWILLHHPGMQPYLRAALHRASPIGEIDGLRENWWCRLGPDPSMQEAIYLQRGRAESARPQPSRPGRPDLGLAFLSDEQRGAAARELVNLSEVPTAPNYLCRETLRWSKERPNDPRLPEALHLAVRATRYGCADRETTDLSRRCFQLLHRRFPDNRWTKATKYWY